MAGRPHRRTPGLKVALFRFFFWREGARFALEVTLFRSFGVPSRGLNFFFGKCKKYTTPEIVGRRIKTHRSELSIQVDQQQR